MNSRERYLRALTFQGPDRAPLFHFTLPGAFRVHGRALEELYARYPSDVLLSPVFRGHFGFKMGYFAGRPLEEIPLRQVVYDGWGCGFLFLTQDHGGQAVGHPLANWGALDSYRPPDPLVGLEGIEEDVRHMQEVVLQDGQKHFVYAHGDHVFYRMVPLRGYEDLLVDLAEDRPEVYALRDMVVEWNLRRIERWLETGLVDGILLRDDWGTQTSLMVRPATWRKVFKPAYKRLVEAIHRGGAYASLHTHGYTWEILSDLVELGFDEVNHEAQLMDLKEQGRRYAGKVCFRPELDRQHILPHGTPQEVRAHVRRMFDVFGQSNGGYVGYGGIGADVPLPNVEAMLDAVWALSYSTKA